MSEMAMDRIGAMHLLSSGLALFHQAGNDALDAAQKLSAGAPDSMLDEILQLQMARREVKIGAAIIRTQQELDDAILDMIV